MIRERATSLGRQALALTIAGGATQVLTIGSYAVLARSGGAASVGHVSVAYGIAAVISGLIDFGANNLWVRGLANGSLEPLAYRLKAAKKILVGGVLALVLSVATLSYSNLKPFFGIGVFAFCWILTQTLQVGLRAEGRNEAVSLALILDRGVGLALFLVLTYAQALTPTFAFVVSYFCGSMLSGLVTLLLTPKTLRPKFSTVGRAAVWEGSSHFGMYGVITMAQGLDVVATSWAAGPATAGSYGAVTRWTQPVLLPAGALATALKPLFARHGITSASRAGLKSGAWLAALSIGSGAVIFLAADPLVRLVIGPEFADSVPALRLLALGATTAALTQPLTSLLQFTGHERITMWVYGTGTLIQLSLVFPLAARYGATGAALCYLLGQLVITAGLLFAARSARASDHTQIAIQPSANELK